jgi:hypothetical protein
MTCELFNGYMIMKKPGEVTSMIKDTEQKIMAMQNIKVNS